jgi:ribosome maturation factor RimP
MSRKGFDMTGRSPNANKVFEALAARIGDLGIELVDVELVREGQARILRLIIDKPDGVDHEDCSNVSRLADPVIDQELQLRIHDYLEVSSPGLERPLKTERDFLRYRGEWVEVTLYKAQDGQKKYSGRLGACTSDLIRLEPDKEPPGRQFARDQIAKVKRIIK